MSNVEYVEPKFINRDVNIDADGQCPIHGDSAVDGCWPCHVAGVLADPSSCEPNEDES